MKDSKDYFVANIVTKEEMQCKGYMDFLLSRMKERISNGILDIVSDGNEYAIKMLPEQRIERPGIMTVEVRNGISVKELVRCGECGHYHSEDDPAYCDELCTIHIEPTDGCLRGIKRGAEVGYRAADGERKDGERDV